MNEGDEYFYDKLEWVRIRIEEEHWSDLSPVAPSERDNETVEERRSPYSLTVSFTKAQDKWILMTLGFHDAIWTWTS